MPYFEHSGLTFYYADVGKGMPFIFQHGLGGSTDQILKIYSPLSSVRLITFDFRAHGKTSIGERGELNFKTFADDILGLMDHLHLQQAIIGGISMGASVALNFALRYPSRVLALILSRPAWLDGPMEKQNRDMYSTVARLMEEYGAERGRELFIDSDVCKQLSKNFPVIAEALVGLFNHEKAAETAIKFVSLPADMPSEDRCEWKQINVPTLVLVNKSDPVHPYEYGAVYISNIRNADLREITSKAINEEQHQKDVQKNIDLFIRDLVNKNYSRKNFLGRS